MAIINTGAVERTITGVNESDLFLDESNSNVTNTGAVERDIEASHDANFVHPLGDELVLNGQFDTGSDWNLTNASISGGKLNVNSSSPVYIIQNNVATIGKLYKVKFTVSDYVEGDLRLRNPFIISESEFTGNGTYVFYGTADDTRFQLQGRFSGQTYNYSIDNVSVKEVLVNRESDITNTGVTIRDIEGVNESDEMFPDNTESSILNVGEEILPLLNNLESRSTYYENEENTINLLKNLNC